MVYLDYSASCPVDNDVLELFSHTVSQYYANPNSNHKLGKEALKLIEKATVNISKNLGILPEEIIYTSGATESNNLAVFGALERYKNRGKHVIVSALEHNSIISPITNMQDKGYTVDILPILKDGTVDLDKLKSLLRSDTILVSICSIDSELGIRQPIEEIAELLRDYPNCIFHTDASQAIGKVKIDFSNVDLVTINPHKFYGLPGFGILIKKKKISLKPIIYGGKSTTIYRSGTPLTAFVVSTDLALERAILYQNDRYKYVNDIYNNLIKELNKFEMVHINNTNKSCPFIINISIKGISSVDFVKSLENYNVYVSVKTSCCPTNKPSKLVYALTHDKNLSLSTIRISLSHLTTSDEISEFLEAFRKTYYEYIK